jgi:hypothetical protein
VSQHDTSVPHSVQVSIDETSVLRPNANTLRRPDPLLHE